ncbi:MAG: trehalose-6-phosphate synthase [Actinobacteria bacterium]|nr:trehalose-6-phosphate synthase [Actinomycetota bacterium]MBU4218731.1 trehalose-6-phosphate synthase [Actinomycetota bacterium]MBU4359460.1 trehalose-6-phosphate synthase [Actinomycetota bacterium]MBU4402887.1 trehalose-6-phosphate synthase [Actinomycetota bacterium]MCG2819124.1 trehalose-6-phosphate synthase [Actinomycetes bacterium]
MMKPAADKKSVDMHQLLEGHSLIFASNRGPVEFRTDEDGTMTPHRGAGGMVSALEAALRGVNATWVASAMTPEDETVAHDSGGGAFAFPPEDPTYSVRLIPIEGRAYHRYYDVISNLLLWFMQHYLWDIPFWPDVNEHTHRAWAEGYQPVNELFAGELVKAASESPGKPLLMLQDYHLYLCARHIRERMPDALIHHFTHSPWCQPDYLRLLPPYMRNELVEGLLSCDVVSFHTDRYATNFLWCCRQLTDHPVDLARGTVRVGERRVLVRHHPISIDYQGLAREAGTDEVSRHRKEIRHAVGGRKMILRVDRVELSKNILRGFKLYREFLNRYHEWWGKVVFLAFLYPSRLGLAVYRRYIADIEAEVEALNEEFATKSWQPVVLEIEDNYPRSLAGLCEYDVLMVNPLFDGMNLVSKEGAVLNKRNGVLLLSENAGSFDELEGGVIPISPLDVEGGAGALNEALLMNEGERARRASELVRVVRGNTAADWLAGQVEDIMEAGRTT